MLRLGLLLLQIGAAMVIGTLVAILIVDRAGRRQLLIVGGIQMCLTEVSCMEVQSAKPRSAFRPGMTPGVFSGLWFGLPRSAGRIRPLR